MNQAKWEQLHGAYKYVLNSREGQVVLKDLAEFVGIIPDPEKMKEGRLSHLAGSEMSHAECAYRNGAQDLYKYIESYVSEDKN